MVAPRPPFHGGAAVAPQRLAALNGVKHQKDVVVLGGMVVVIESRRREVAVAATPHVMNQGFRQPYPNSGRSNKLQGYGVKDGNSGGSQSFMVAAEGGDAHQPPDIVVGVDRGLLEALGGTWPPFLAGSRFGQRQSKLVNAVRTQARSG